MAATPLTMLQRAEDKLLKKAIPAGTFRQTSKNYREYVRNDSLPVISWKRLKAAYKDALEQKNNEVDETIGRIRTVLSVKNENFSYNPFSNPIWGYVPFTVTMVYLNSKASEIKHESFLGGMKKAAAEVGLVILKFFSAIEKKSLEHVVRNPLVNAVVLGLTYGIYAYSLNNRKPQNLKGEALMLLAVTAPYIIPAVFSFLKNEKKETNTTDNIRDDVKGLTKGY